MLILRALHTRLLIPAFLLPAALAQTPAAPFKPGQWKIDSTVTASGRSISSQQTVCANNTSDFWSHQQPNLQCDAPAVSSVAAGVRVQIACHGGTGPVSWSMQSTVTETFNSDGTSFTATGSTTTTTTVPGNGPITATATSQSHGTYLGSCSAKK